MKTQKIKLTKNDALGEVDPLNDFFPPKGTLPVPNAEEIIDPLNKIEKMFSVVLVFCDYHEEDTVHFKNWPKHCVKGTWGAQFHPRLHAGRLVKFLKGIDPNDDAGYSGFEGRNKDGLLLGEYLKLKGIKRLFIGGLATDYCVKATVLDALQRGIAVVVVVDAIKAVNLKASDGEKALKEMKDAGAVFTTSDQIY